MAYNSCVSANHSDFLDKTVSFGEPVGRKMNISDALPHKAEAELRFARPSTPSAVSATVRTVRMIMEWMAFEQDWVFRTELCLHEALLNAHFHGNHGDANREIRIVCRLAPDKVELDVEDEGQGYRSPGNPLVRGENFPHGRGLYLIRQFMNSVGIYSNGKRIVMSLKKE